ncbi:MAG: NAD(P)/FAD-dependent oxidoreductase [Anaerolineae bacterium]|nr:NAD(P)/FAD-dependent oxidoreductase [Anaerolineae bacterium]
MADDHRPVVAIIGAGFGGLYAARQLMKADVDILLVDRQNFHLFTPLLYQVATSGLEPGEIAYPVRGILRGKPHARFLLGSVEAIDPDSRTLTVQTEQEMRHESYDYLIVAAGTTSHFYGMAQVEQHAFGLKTLADAITLRNHLLKCLESAAWQDDPIRKRALTTFVVVGGGPTGLETAGALQELIRYVLGKEYGDQIPEHAGRVILVEARDYLLESYPPRLQEAALKQLEALGVEVLLGTRIVEAADDHIRLSDGQVIPTHTLIWAAGVAASPVAGMLGIPLHRTGRVPVLPFLHTAEYDTIYVVGDMAYLEDDQGVPYPMLIPVAKQQGMLAARNIIRRLKHEPQKPFTYKGLRDRGVMATIGRSRAVAWIFYKIHLTGFAAWLAWLVLHLITLMGFRNRLNVFVNWVWNYLTYDRAVRIILEHIPRGAAASGTPGAGADPIAHPLENQRHRVL